MSDDTSAFVRHTVYGIDPRRAERTADDIDRVLPFLVSGVDVERTARLAQFAHDLRNLGRDEDD